MRVDGQVALVTGAGRGIGRGCALALAEAGAEVIAMSRTESEIAEVVPEMEAMGCCARAIPCDITDQDAVTAAFEGIKRLDILVNNARAIIGKDRGPVWELDESEWQHFLNINLTAVYLTIKFTKFTITINLK